MSELEEREEHCMVQPPGREIAVALREDDRVGGTCWGLLGE